jgi:hypothetical protein|tara:strand:+ start:3078 stop:3572 length:495 start_codon:yes stop_codon:yes gene_type:complete
MLFYKILITLFIILIIISVIFIYHINNNTITINQTTINKFDFYLLYQKNPLIISDHIPDLTTILESWFKYNYISKIQFTNNWKLNNSKYLLLHNNSDTDIEIHICNPNTKIENNIPTQNAKIITINLSSLQFIIIPYKWFYYNDNINTNMFNINDHYTKLLSIL